MDFSFTEEQRLMRDSVRKAMDRVATPEYVRRLDREQAYPYELYDAWVELGFLRIPFDEAWAAGRTVPAQSTNSPHGCAWMRGRKKPPYNMAYPQKIAVSPETNHRGNHGSSAEV